MTTGTSWDEKTSHRRQKWNQSRPKGTSIFRGPFKLIGPFFWDVHMV